MQNYKKRMFGIFKNHLNYNTSKTLFGILPSSVVNDGFTANVEMFKQNLWLQWSLSEINYLGKKLIYKCVFSKNFSILHNNKFPFKSALFRYLHVICCNTIARCVVLRHAREVKRIDFDTTCMIRVCKNPVLYSLKS